MAPTNRDQHRGRTLQAQPAARSIAPRRNVLIQPKEALGASSHGFQKASNAQAESADSAPTAGNDSVPAFNELSYEKQQKINDLTLRLASWETLSINAAARGESLPQARQRALTALIHAGNPHLPVSRSPPPGAATHNRRLHESEPAGQRAASQRNGQRQSSHGDRRAGKKKDTGKGEGSEAERNKGTARQKWYDLVEIEWEDRMKYINVPQTSGSQAREVDSGEASSQSRSPGHAKKKRKEEPSELDTAT